MAKWNTRVFGTCGALLGLCFSGVAQSEDGFIGPFVNGPSFEDAVLNTRPGSLLVGLRGQFVISLAYIGSGNFDIGGPSACEPVKARVEELIDAGNGEVGLRVGDILTLEPWTWSRQTYRSVTNGPELIGLRLRSEKPSEGCNVVASGLFYPEGGNGPLTPLPFPLMPSGTPPSTTNPLPIPGGFGGTPPAARSGSAGGWR